MVDLFAAPATTPRLRGRARAGWRIVYDFNLQSTHCREEPAFTGRWLSPRRDGQWWRVWSCAGHIDRLTSVREFGRRHQ